MSHFTLKARQAPSDTYAVELLCSIINNEGWSLGNAVWATPQNLRFFDSDFVARCVARARPKLTDEAVALLDGEGGAA